MTQDGDDTAAVGNEAFTELWQEVNNVFAEVYESKSFTGLVEFEWTKRDKYALDYSI